MRGKNLWKFYHNYTMKLSKQLASTLLGADRTQLWQTKAASLMLLHPPSYINHSNVMLSISVNTLTRDTQ